MKTTHIKVDTLGDHCVQGWWVSKNKPKFEKYVVIEAVTAYNRAIDETVEFLHKQGIQRVQVLPCTILS